MRFTGHLTIAELNRALTPVTVRLSKGTKVQLLFDCLAMTGYDKAARDGFVEWHKQTRLHILRVAIVTKNPLWSVVIAGMSLASGRSMKAFASQALAEQWLQTAPPHG